MSDSSYTAVTRHRMLINGDKAACRPADLQLVDDEWVASKLSPDDFNHPKDIIDDEEVSEIE